MPKLTLVCPNCQKEFSRYSGSIFASPPCCSAKCSNKLSPKKKVTPVGKIKFWPRVNVSGPGDCWEWQSCKDSSGYGNLRVEGKVIHAHRLAYIFKHGLIPLGLSVCHRCDNPPCCNPSHLFLGTQVDNNHDRDNKGRTSKGELSGKVKLKKQQVLEIVELFATGKYTRRELATKFNISRPTIYRITTKTTWRHLFQT